MEQSYDLTAVVKFALRREVMAWRTYDRLALRTKDSMAMNAVLQLVEFERGHIRQFTEVLRPQIEAIGIDPEEVVRGAEQEPLDLGGFLEDALKIPHVVVPEAV